VAVGKCDHQITVLFLYNDTNTAKGGQVSAHENIEGVEEDADAFLEGVVKHSVCSIKMYLFVLSYIIIRQQSRSKHISS
jgi:hypothetical protein